MSDSEGSNNSDSEASNKSGSERSGSDKSGSNKSGSDNQSKKSGEDSDGEKSNKSSAKSDEENEDKDSNKQKLIQPLPVSPPDSYTILQEINQDLDALTYSLNGSFPDPIPIMPYVEPAKEIEANSKEELVQTDPKMQTVFTETNEAITKKGIIIPPQTELLNKEYSALKYSPYYKNREDIYRSVTDLYRKPDPSVEKAISVLLDKNKS
jgi:hypothetical protein